MSSSQSGSATDASHEGADPALAGGRLTIDLEALAANYRLLADRVTPAKAAGVIKADAYGLGAARVAPVLWREGCRRFFVALPEEGIALRGVLPEAEIFVLNGLFGPEAAAAFRAFELKPVLGSAGEIAMWKAAGDEHLQNCAIHVDTGMNRLGLGVGEAMELAQSGVATPALVMSHLACGDDPQHALNRAQLESFQAVSRAFAQSDSSRAQ